MAMQLRNVAAATSVAFILACANSPLAADVPKVVSGYFNKSQQVRINKFQKDFTRALKQPDRIEWIGEIYTDGFSGVGYNEFGPSFVAYIDLHQSLYRLMRDDDHHGLPVPPELRQEFKVASAKFMAHVAKLGRLKKVEDYGNQVHGLYTDFLVGFIKKHHAYFKARFIDDVTKFVGFYGRGLDTIDCAFFALQKDWPGDELSEHKYQFEQLYAYHCIDGRTMLLGYNQRNYACERILHIYLWNPKSPDSIPVKVSQPNMEFNLSPIIHEGGCDHLAKVPDVIRFNDGRFLHFYGYEYTVFRYYIYDVIENKWQITQIPSKRRYDYSSLNAH